MNLDINNYPGSKNASGLKEWIINHIPECKYFVEGFGGSAIVSRTIAELLPTDADVIIYIIENDFSVVKQLRTVIQQRNITVYCCSFFDMENPFGGNETLKDTVFYLDPPYLLSTRKKRAKLYRHDWISDEIHLKFLQVVKTLSSMGARIIISHYDNELYNENLSNWNKETMHVRTRGGTATETIYFNFDHTAEQLLITDYVGSNNTDRQRVNRKKVRFVQKLKKCPPHERQAIIDHIRREIQGDLLKITYR